MNQKVTTLWIKLHVFKKLPQQFLYFHYVLYNCATFIYFFHCVLVLMYRQHNQRNKTNVSTNNVQCVVCDISLSRLWFFHQSISSIQFSVSFSLIYLDGSMLYIYRREIACIQHRLSSLFSRVFCFTAFSIFHIAGREVPYIKINFLSINFASRLKRQKGRKESLIN